MKKIILPLFAFIWLSYGVSAQSTSVFLCSKVADDANGNTNVEGVFSGFNARAVGKNESFTIYVRFQGFSLNAVHRYRLLLESPTGKELIKTEESSFSFLKVTDTRAHIADWRVYFDAEGLYTVKVYVDNKEVERLYFNVGKE